MERLEARFNGIKNNCIHVREDDTYSLIPLTTSSICQVENGTQMEG